jgi:hypothetical protein
MTQPSPTLEGFRRIFRKPSLGWAEVAWRSSFAVASALLLGLAAAAYLNSLPLTRADLLLFGSGRPALVGRALGHILAGSGPRLAEAATLLAVALGGAWVVTASFARMAILGVLATGEDRPEAPESGRSRMYRPQLPSLLVLNTLRLALLLLAAVSSMAALLAALACSAPSTASASSFSASSSSFSSPLLALLVCFAVIIPVWLTWCGLDWLIGLAIVVAVVEERDAMGSLARAVAACKKRTAALLAATVWFSLARLTLLSLAWAVAGFFLAFAALLPGKVVLPLVLAVYALYRLTVDFLATGRLAAYTAIVKRGLAA